LDATSSIQTQLDTKQVTITGAATTIDTENLTTSRVLVSDGSGKVAVSGVTTTELNKLDGATLSTTELNYVDGVTSAIQTQLAAHTTEDTALEARRTANIAGAISSVLTSDLTASRVLEASGAGKVSASSITSTTLGYLDATSSIQTQLNAKGSIPSNTMHTSSTANSYATGSATSNIDQVMVFINGTYQNEHQYILGNSTHNVQFKVASLGAGLNIEIRKF